jgi:hypothetical protein
VAVADIDRRPTLYVETVTAGTVTSFQVPSNAVHFALRVRSATSKGRWATSLTAHGPGALAEPYSEIGPGEGYSQPDVPSNRVDSACAPYLHLDADSGTAVFEVSVS